ncbi:hypothetical protein HKCCE2091_08840 [Rhodobacterales bacterium HKCCE2091]|nr:hypothetical protein [Rhodobacterales bacterium HKCCE2091]
MTPAVRRNEEIALGLAIAAVGGVFLWAAYQIPAGRDLVGPRSLPALVAGLLSLGGLAISARAWFGLAAPETGGSETERKLLRVVLPAVAVALAALWLWGAVGWTLASLMVAPVFFGIFGARGWKELVLFPCCAVGLLYLIFYRLLGLWHGTGWLIERLGLS